MVLRELVECVLMNFCGCLAIDQFASKEGLPAGADPMMNNFVNDEVNKF